ncbi:MAG: phosphatase family protein [Candidatus Saccharibacteria bacterium]|nr:phosphatase family protein [Candidatus Saccharibacteria bacterium]
MNVILTLIAKYLFVVVGLVALAYWLTLPKKLKIRVAVFGVVTALVAYALTKIGAALFYDTRPFVADHVTPLYAHGADNGFPSDHTVLTAFVAVTIYSVSKKLGLVLMSMALLIGLSRVIGHIHRPIDILGSLAFALTGGAVAHYVTPKIIERYKISQ